MLSGKQWACRNLEALRAIAEEEFSPAPHPWSNILLLDQLYGGYYIAALISAMAVLLMLCCAIYMLLHHYRSPRRSSGPAVSRELFIDPIMASVFACSAIAVVRDKLRDHCEASKYRLADVFLEDYCRQCFAVAAFAMCAYALYNAARIFRPDLRCLRYERLVRGLSRKVLFLMTAFAHGLDLDGLSAEIKSELLVKAAMLYFMFYFAIVVYVSESAYGLCTRYISRSWKKVLVLGAFVAVHNSLCKLNNGIALNSNVYVFSIAVCLLTQQFMMY
ncbi:protein E6 [Proboscivirus elephantidbeta4]|uniref:Protein E6 n=1 Tax=Elephant endotheliotropic herpesvirus 4 TaxID=548914 RepID=A0A0S1TQ37_9BETA|nr:protein E6 [Elephant endotheliotropic herpesvirus 4]ALM25936.1 protein E6 [Elephant endotheliotropic herpesvirus 4]